MYQLPEKFITRMREQLGDEFEAFLDCYEAEEYAGLRVNTSKISVEDFLALTPFELTPVPWTENGFYYRKSDPVTKHPHYYAGLYYIQEPSAMLPASRLPVDEGCLVLDLCAAPGGKATELSSRLSGTGMLVANDASASRAKALLKNLTVWGSANCCITGETPQKLLDKFGCCFDRILVDAPCSGEGMFRKDSHLIADWLERGPKYYASIQKEILNCAVQMLKPGGMLLYSTCTFSEEEDEDVIAEMLQQFPELTLEEPEPFEGAAHGKAPCEAALRVWPHRVKGEGHFLALLKKAESAHENSPARKTGGVSADDSRRYTESDIRKSQKKMPEEVRAFLEQLPDKLWKDCMYAQIGEQCLLLPPYKIPSGLRYLRTGILAGTYKKGRFEPSQPLAMLLGAASFPLVFDLPSDDPRVLRYLKGETVELAEEEEQKKNGWVLVCTDGYALGWGKYVNGTIRNKYYPGWRLQ